VHSWVQPWQAGGRGTIVGQDDRRRLRPQAHRAPFRLKPRSGRIA
jgi:hypothetical protein